MSDPIKGLSTAIQLLAKRIRKLETRIISAAYILSNSLPENVGPPTAGTDIEASRSDHSHGHGDQPGGSLHSVATTSAAGFILHATAPSVNELNVVGIANGETAYSNKAIFDATDPANVGASAPGTALKAAHRDHVHGHGDQPGGSLHSLSSLESAGFEHIDGWLGTSDTWTYVSATSFKITGKDVTAYYPTGTKLRCKQGGGYKYFYAVSAVYSTDTTVTITGGSDYSLTNASITDNYVSYAIPLQGFPDWFNYTPTLTGWDPEPSNSVYRFTMHGKTVIVQFCQGTGGTSSSATSEATLPVSCKSLTYYYSGGANNLAQDGGSYLTVASRWVVPGSSVSKVAFFKDMYNTGWSLTGAKRIIATLIYEAE